jgi:hypothetical protein
MTIRRYINVAIFAVFLAGAGMLSDAVSANLDRAQTALSHITGGSFHG